MARKRSGDDDSFELVFPFGGLNESVAYSKQPPVTSPIVTNCRVKDQSEDRARGGQRPGLSKVFAEQAGDDRPVLKMVVITNTYIDPEVV